MQCHVITVLSKTLPMLENIQLVPNRTGRKRGKTCYRSQRLEQGTDSAGKHVTDVKCEGTRTDEKRGKDMTAAKHGKVDPVQARENSKRCQMRRKSSNQCQMRG